MITRVFNRFTDSPNRVHGDEGARSIGFPRALVPGIVTYGILEASRWPIHRARFLKPIFDGDLIQVNTDRAVGADDGEPRIVIEALDGVDWREDEGEWLKPVELTIADPLSRGVSVTGAVLDLAHQILMTNYDWGPWLHVRSEVENHGAPRADAVYQVSGRIAWPREGRAQAWIRIESGGELVQRVVHRVKLP